MGLKRLELLTHVKPPEGAGLCARPRSSRDAVGAEAAAGEGGGSAAGKGWRGVGAARRRSGSRGAARGWDAGSGRDAWRRGRVGDVTGRPPTGRLERDAGAVGALGPSGGNGDP